MPRNFLFRKFTKDHTKKLLSDEKHKELISKVHIVSDVQNNKEYLNVIKKYGEHICGGEISKEFIEQVVEKTNNLLGFSVTDKSNEKTLGFVLYKKIGRLEYELILICSLKGGLKGFPLGRLMMKYLEKEIGRNIILKLKSVKSAIKFYESLGFEKGNKVKGEPELTHMKKKIRN
jgi:hypothetical protein